MRKTLLSLAFLGFCHGASAESSSVYTDLDAGKDCSVFAAAGEGEGEWANLVCSGWKGYPVTIFSGDLRQSVFYGFSPGGDVAWESFSAFNSTGPKVEWRIDTRNGVSAPYAAIHRWFVNDEIDAAKKVEVLVVSKVGTLRERQGCTVGLVLATGNAGANAMARTIADEQARDFACGADERVLVGDPMPSFERTEN